jgi:hypothetical protein
MISKRTLPCKRHRNSFCVTPDIQITHFDGIKFSGIISNTNTPKHELNKPTHTQSKIPRKLPKVQTFNYQLSPHLTKQTKQNSQELNKLNK